MENSLQTHRYWEFELLSFKNTLNHHPHDVSFHVSLRKNSDSVSIRYDLKRTEESKSTPTEYLKLIIMGMVTPY